MLLQQNKLSVVQLTCMMCDECVINVVVVASAVSLSDLTTITPSLTSVISCTLPTAPDVYVRRLVTHLCMS
jgi:hypothetical protein